MIVRFYINKVETENTNDNVIGGLNVDYFSLITSENTMNEMMCLWLSCFYRKQTHHMKTTDHKNIEPRLVETRG